VSRPAAETNQASPPDARWAVRVGWCSSWANQAVAAGKRWPRATRSTSGGLSAPRTTRPWGATMLPTTALTVAMAAITGTYDGTVTLADQVAPASYRLIAEGKGRAGFLNGSSDIRLRAEGATTVVDVTGTVQTGGPIARLGQRLVGGVSKMMLDRFFACMQGKVPA